MDNNNKFEVGEEVIVNSFYSGFFTQKIIEITKAGNIKLENKMIFYPNGTLRGDTGYHHTHMYKMDDEWRKRVEKRELIQKITTLVKSDNLKKFNNDKLKKIISILEGI